MRPTFFSLTSVVWPWPHLSHSTVYWSTLGFSGSILNEHHLNPISCTCLNGRRCMSQQLKMMQSALDTFLRQFITVGRLTVRWPDGRTQIYAGRPGPEAGVILRDRRTVWRLMLNPKLSVGEAYMDGGLVSLGGSIHDVLEVCSPISGPIAKGPLSLGFGVRLFGFGARSISSMRERVLAGTSRITMT
jgi:hypothetical protein